MIDIINFLIGATFMLIAFAANPYDAYGFGWWCFVIGALMICGVIGGIIELIMD